MRGPARPTPRAAANDSETVARGVARPSAPTLPTAPPHASTPGAPGALPTLERLAGYELEGELARGGMGVVYVARDPRLDRRVAIKLLRAGDGASPAQLERFEREARAASRLRHPHLVAVHEVGEDQGRPYLVMDLVPGRSLLEAIQQDGPLEPRAAARLARQLAQALQHAHEHAILHRDVKPANVLVDERGDACLTDFGLAKSLQPLGGERERLRREREGASERPPGDKEVEGERGVTITGEVVGTPAYMAPEQAEGDLARIDRRADVYGLGATLYAALTGSAPFGGASVLQTLERVKTQDPVAPRARRPELERDLETICLRCLEKDPAERYPTAAEVADDLTRYLEDRPILARPPSLADRGRKWLRRNRTLATVSASLLALAGAVLVTGAVWFSVRLQAALTDAEGQAARAEAEATRANAEAERANAQAERAQEAEHKATLRAFAANESARVSLETLSKLAFELREELDRIPGPGARALEARIVELIRDDLDELRSLGARNDVLTQLEVLLSHEAPEGEAGNAARLAALERARELVASPPPGTEPGAYDLLLFRCLDSVGDDRFNAGDLAGAERYFTEVLELRRARLTSAEPPDMLRSLGYSLRAMGLLRQAQGRLQEALRFFAERTALTRRVEAQDPSAGKPRIERCTAEVEQATLARQVGQLETCRQLLQPAEATLRAHLAQRPGDPEARQLLARALETRAELAGLAGDRPGAIERLEQALTELRRVLEQNPDSAQAAWDVARVTHDLGTQQAAAGRPEDARANFADAAARYEAICDAHPELPSAQQGRRQAVALRARVAWLSGDLPTARARWEASGALLAAALAGGSPEVRWNYGVNRERLAECLDRQGELEGARALWLEASQVFLPLATATPPRIDAVFEQLRIWRTIYQLEQRLPTDPQTALAHGREGLRWARRYHELTPEAEAAGIQLANSLYVVAELALAAEEGAEALTAIEEARAWAEGVLAAAPDDLGTQRTVSVYLSTEAMALGAVGRHTEAIETATEAFETYYRYTQAAGEGTHLIRILVWRQLERVGAALLAGADPETLREDAVVMLENYAAVDATERRGLTDLRPTVDADGQAGIDAQFREHEEKVQLLRTDPRWEALRQDGTLQAILDRAGL
ncbi:MAG: serine/threonine-protein kinase [Planctomycetota bacterium]